MSDDARFEDGVQRPLRLRALDAEDLSVLSGLVQDSVLTGADLSYRAAERRFALLLNRFRWEDAPSGGHSPERVRALLVIEDVQSVRSQGVSAQDKDSVLSLLAVQFHPSTDGMGRVELIFAGDGVIAIEVEALELVLRDVTRPYGAVSGQVPSHPQ